MTIRFAAARGGTRPTVPGRMCTGARLDAVNDNAAPYTARLQGRAARPAYRTDDDASLAAALMHFARHGLSAATRAGDEAEASLAKGDVLACTRWLEICRRLDRRMAHAVALRLRV